MFYFQLLRGVHSENAVRYEATPVKNEEGVVIGFNNPVIKSQTDLAKAFGTEKFKRLSEQEANALLSIEKASELSDSGSDENSSPVAKAVRKGSRSTREVVAD